MQPDPPCTLNIPTSLCAQGLQTSKHDSLRRLENPNACQTPVFGRTE